MEEVWKDIKGYEGHYQISNMGRLKNLKNSRITEGSKDSRGYIKINLYKYNNLTKKYDIKGCFLHRLVAEHFVSNPFNKELVNHIDENPSNCRANNLEWVTYKENSNHATRNERIIRSTEVPVCEYNHKGELQRIWRSATHVRNWIEPEADIIPLRRSCKKDAKLIWGRIWRFYRDTKGENLDIEILKDIQVNKEYEDKYKDVPNELLTSKGEIEKARNKDNVDRENLKRIEDIICKIKNKITYINIKEEQHLEFISYIEEIDEIIKQLLSN